MPETGDSYVQRVAPDPSPWYRSWPVHNLLAHPASEILHWLGNDDLAWQIHELTLPEHEPGCGRG